MLAEASLDRCLAGVLDHRLECQYLHTNGIAATVEKFGSVKAELIARTAAGFAAASIVVSEMRRACDGLDDQERGDHG